MTTNIGDYAKAKFYFDRAIQSEPNDARLYWDLARMYRDGIKNYKIAEKYYLKSLSINNGESGTTNAGYAYLLYLKGDIKNAKKYIDIQMEMDILMVLSWFHR